MAKDQWKLIVSESDRYRTIVNPLEDDIEAHILRLDNDLFSTVELYGTNGGHILVVGGDDDIVAVHCTLNLRKDNWYRVINPSIVNDGSMIELQLPSEPTWFPTRCGITKKVGITAALDFYRTEGLSSSLTWIDSTGNIVK